jgi:hypothetical protein
MAAVQWIFPTSIYGSLGDVYGTAVTQYNTYPNTTGFPAGSGLILGMFGILFDGTVTRMLAANVTIAQYSACTYVVGNSNDYTVALTTTANTVPITAFADRSGTTSLVQNNYAWMTTWGIGTAKCAGSLTAPLVLCGNGTSGQLAGVTAGTSTQFNLFLLNTTTTAGGYPVKIA